MKNWAGKPGLAFFVLCCLLGFFSAARAQQKNYGQFCRELAASKFKIVGSGVAYGVPFVEVKIPLGASITSFCQSIPSLNNKFELCRNRIAFFNALNPNYLKTRVPQPNSIEASTLKIPLDMRQVPEIFPDYDASLEKYPKYLLVDIGKNFLAVYEGGELKRVFPISAGAPGDRTPLISFRILDKDKNYFSRTYDNAWMPYALHVSGAYYIHGGVLPGEEDSHGCIRLPPHDARQLFKLVEVGTPGRIIATPKVDRDIYSAAFCR